MSDGKEQNRCCCCDGLVHKDSIQVYDHLVEGFMVFLVRFCLQAFDNPWVRPSHFHWIRVTQSACKMYHHTTYDALIALIPLTLHVGDMKR